MGLIIRSSAIHAAGCYTTAPIPIGTRIVEYTGPRITKEVADEKYEGSPTTYLFGIGDGEMVIDGHGIAMFINHSCEPNCETEEIDGRVWIMAIKDIPPGAELVYDYFLYDGDEADPAYCNCGAPGCRKTMYAPEEIERRRRKARKAEKQAAGRKRTPEHPARAAKKKGTASNGKPAATGGRSPVAAKRA